MKPKTKPLEHFAILDLLKLLQDFPKAPKPYQLCEVRKVARGFEATPYESPQALKVARDLDIKVEALLISAAA